MSSKEMPMLVVVEGSASQRMLIDQPVILVGRGDDCDLVVSDRQVSRRHARIRQEEDSYVLEDLNSKNGTFLNGQEVTSPQRLKDGDSIQIALCCRITFVDAEATAPLELDQAPVGLRMDVEAKRVWVGQTEVSPPLSLAQFRFLALLYSEPGRVFSRDEIVSRVWPDEEREGISEQAIDALARRLRERLVEIDPHTQYVVTVRGHGFRLENAIL
jgi:hypothetical protein